MKIRSKATLTLRAMLARRYGFGASPNKPPLCHLWPQRQMCIRDRVLKMKILLKILVAPFALALSLLAALLVFLFEICAVLLTIASVILVVLGIALFFTPTPIGGIVFLFLAFLLSPYGLQAAAGSLLWALDGGKSALYRFLAS